MFESPGFNVIKGVKKKEKEKKTKYICLHSWLFLQEFDKAKPEVHSGLAVDYEKL